MPDLPLTGRGIAITRPVEQAGVLAGMIQDAGGTAISFPLLAISPLDDYVAFDHIIEALPSYDWAIFISSNAVQQAMPRIAARFPQLPHSLRFAAIGPATAQELKQFGVDQVLIPENRYDSESLLARPELQDMQAKRVLIVRGVGGRELMAETLRQRGAEVVFAECYRRINPQHDVSALERAWQQGQLHALVVTSSEALRNLMHITGEETWLQRCLICVNHPRIAETAASLGFLHLAVAEMPGDPGMLQCLIHQLQDRLPHE